MTNATNSRNEQRQRQTGRGDGPDRRARRREHDELAVGVQAIERVNYGDEERERGDDRHEVREAERRHLDEHQGALTLRRHDVELAQRERDPDDAR